VYRKPSLHWLQQSGAGVCFDIGHAYACAQLHPDWNIYEHYILPNEGKIVSAHIYHIEVDGVGHLAPESIQDMYNRLEMLKIAESCNWWVIELQRCEEVLRTRDFLINYLEASSRSSSQSPFFSENVS